MSNMKYTINKGINRPLEFRGLKAQYVTYLVVGLVGLLPAFGILYFSGVPSYICILVTLAAAGGVYNRVFAMSKRWGQYGLMKRRAARRLPTVIRVRSRRIFINF